MDLNELFSNSNNLMAQQLQSNSIINHPGEKGDDTNQRWIDWFRNYLPKRYSVDKAIIIDSEGNVSNQIDIVIYDRIFSPPLIEGSNSKYITAESVYAVFEVKQTINKENIEYAMDKAKSVRLLKRTYTSFKESKGTSTTIPKPIIAGILAKTSNNMDSEHFKKLLQSNDKHRQLQFGCCCKSAFYHDGTNAEVNTGNATTVWFFYRLLKELQQIGSVPAIDYEAYLKHT